MNWGDLPAYVALGLSIVALSITRKFNLRQKKFFDNQELLNKQMLRQIDEQTREKKLADFGARIVKLGQSSHRLKIFNSGKAPGRNIRVEMLEGTDLLVGNELDDKFPADQIDPGSGIEMMIAMFLGSGTTKMKMRILWEDDYSMNHEKVVTAHF